MKKFILISTVFFVSLVWTLSSQAAEPIKIGIIQVLSGGVGQTAGVPDVIGAKMAVDEINSAGGILGRPLKVIERDDKMNPENGIREAKDLILNEKVNWIQGVTSSSVALAVSSYCREQKVLFFCTTASSETLTEEKGHRYVARMNTNNICYTRAVANGAFKYWGGLKKVFILCPDYEFGHRAAKDFMVAYTKLVPDAKVVGELWPKLGTTDFTPYIPKIMSSDCDLIYCELFGGDLVAFTKAAWGYGLFDKKKIGGAVLGNLDFLMPMANIEEYPKGAVGAAQYPFWLINNSISNAFWPKFKKVSGRDVGATGAFGYTTVYTMKKAIEKAGSVDTEKMIDALEGLELDSVVGRLKIRACDHQSTWPYWVGQITKSADHPWPFISKPILLDPEKCIHSCTEVEAIRKQQP